MSGRVLLVTGASGNLGREVVERLLARGRDDRLIAGTRDPPRLDDLAARGVEVRRLDFDDEAALAAGFAGVDRALLVSTDALDAPGRRAAQHVRAIRAAVAAGVDHLVYTSCPNPSPASALLLSHDHATSEAALVDAGVGHTVLRDNLYAELLLRSIPAAIASGRLVTARGDGAAGYVTRSDCARVAAAALADDFTGRRVLDVTGPAALTGDDLAAIASELGGRPVVHVPVRVDDWVRAGIDAGLPRPLAELFGAFEVAVARGEMDVVADTVATLGGAPATSARDFLAGRLGADRAA